jgi:hypothetical protein
MKNVALISPGLHRGAAKVFTSRLDETIPDRAAILVLQVLENSSQHAF